MCGIAGIVRFDNERIDQYVVKSMTDVISHRGPDGAGHWVGPDGEVGLGHRRLSIIDLSTSASQPMHLGGRYTITFNGEIYNYKELKVSLEAQGISFQTSSDTEVLLAAYERYGADCLSRLDGMFAFAIWDEQQKELFCARDRFGEKPFYYTLSNQTFSFASEMKSLFAGGHPKNVNRKMVYFHLAFQYLSDPNRPEDTFYDDVMKLPPATWMRISANGNIEKGKYWSLDHVQLNNEISFDDACNSFYDLFKTSVERRLRSDVPVGSSLSGGLDSSAVVAMINELNTTGVTQKTFSARFDDPNLDEGRFMEMVVEGKPIDAHYCWPNADEFMNELDKIFYHQEEPFGTGSPFAQRKVMELARQQDVTVLLDGQGADEVLAGYLHFFRPFISECIATGKDYKTEYQAFEKYHGHASQFSMDGKFVFKSKFPTISGWLKSANQKLRPYRGAAYVNTSLKDEFGSQVELPFKEFSDLNTSLKHHTLEYGLEKLLRFSDRNAMAFSREVRLPFLNHELVELAFSLPSTYKIKDGWTKRVLRQSMADILPKEITWRIDKKGFQPPQEKWEKDQRFLDIVQESQDFLRKEEVINKNHTPPAMDSVMTYLVYHNDL